MQSIASVVGATLFGKDTYPEWWRKKRGRGRRNFRGRGGRNNSSKRSDLKCKRCGKIGHTID